jgi:hypothetical protein
MRVSKNKEAQRARRGANRRLQIGALVTLLYLIGSGKNYGAPGAFELGVFAGQ